MEQLAPSDPGNAQWQRDLAGVYDQLGKRLQEAGQTDAALAVYEKLLAARQHLVAITPSNMQWQPGNDGSAIQRAITSTSLSTPLTTRNGPS